MVNSSSTPLDGFWTVGVLTLLFAMWKLVGYITWPWWWVLSPLWILPLLIGFVVLVTPFAIALAVALGVEIDP